MNAIAYTLPLTAVVKQEKYHALLKQIREIVYNHNQEDLMLVLNHVVVKLHQQMGFTWIGFYFVERSQLVLGPYRGPVAFADIPEKRSCGLAYSKECTIIIDDVEQLPRHIPCGDFDRSEMVVPAFKKGEISLLLSVNSDKIKNFTDVDRINLQQVMHLIEEIL